MRVPDRPRMEKAAKITKLRIVWNFEQSNDISIH